MRIPYHAGLWAAGATIVVSACGQEQPGSALTPPPSLVATTTQAPAPPPTEAPTTTTTLATVTTTEPPEDDPPHASDLPQTVAATRDSIVDAAKRGDLEALGRLASGGEQPFIYSFGEDGDPVSYWTQARPGSGETLGTLADILGKSHAVKQTQFVADVYTTIYVWPGAFAEDPTEEQWAEIGDLYTDDEIALMKEFGGYIGHRVGITEDGEWVFFVAGD